MSDATCAGTTRAGKSCKNNPAENSAYCHLHQPSEEAAAHAGKKAKAAAESIADTQPEGLRDLINELDGLVNQLKSASPDFNPPAYTPQRFIGLIKDNLTRLTPDQLSFVQDIQASMEGATMEDLRDPETWKGMYFILQYQLSEQTSGVRAKLGDMLPKEGLIADLAGSLEGATPQDLMDMDTWKGIYFMINYALKEQAKDIRDKVLRGEQPDEEIIEVTEE